MADETEDKEEGGRSKGGQIVAWAKAFTLVAGGLIAIYGAFFKGEPGAELSYKELAKAFNELRSEFAKEHAFVEGFLAGLKTAPPATAPTAGPAVQPVAKCVAPSKVFVPEPAKMPAPVKKASKTPIQQMQQLPAPMPPTLEQLKKE